VKTLVHAFVTSRVDYCNSVLALSPITITDKLQRVLNSAARLITATGKFDRGLSQLQHDDLHWLDVPQRVQYKLAVMVHRCLGRRARRTVVVVGSKGIREVNWSFAISSEERRDLADVIITH